MRHLWSRITCLVLHVYGQESWAISHLDDGRMDYFPNADRKSVVEGKRVSVRVDLGGRCIIKKIVRVTSYNLIPCSHCFLNTHKSTSNRFTLDMCMNSILKTH